MKVYGCLFGSYGIVTLLLTDCQTDLNRQSTHL